MKTNYKILSVGGSIIIPVGGFDIAFLKKFRDLIIAQVKAGQKFILVIGGGSTARVYQKAGKETVNLNNTNLDWLGIYCTHLNAEFVRLLFGDLAHKEVIKNPNKKITTKKPIIVAAGFEPGCSTDNDAVILAKTFGVKEIFNLSNVDYVYTGDPKTNQNAKKLDKVSWAEFRKIVGDKWVPGKNVPFDPVAAKRAEKLKLKVGFVKGTDLGELGKALSWQKFQGTVIG
ncbi:MAG: UMP kinase [bacterium]|nr:UMP kinase [bacterium]